MTTEHITRSPGIAISGTGLTAGGGRTGSTSTLDTTVQAAAEALSAHYDGAPVTIRFNSDRRSGGAWLQTAEQDGLGKNAEVGITAYAVSDTAVAINVRVSPVGALNEEVDYRRVATIEKAIALITMRALPTFLSIVGRIEVNREEYFARCVRYVAFGVIDGGTVIFQVAPYTTEGRATLEAVFASSAKANRGFSSYQRPHAARIDKGYVHTIDGGHWNSGPVGWKDATEVEFGVTYAATPAGMIEIARDGKLVPKVVAE